MISYTKLGDDLDTIIRSFITSPAITSKQKQIWRKEKNKKAITHEMLGYNHEKALAFEDGTKVGSIKVNTARRFWDYVEGHVFPPIEDVARFCLFMHLDLYNTLTLMLKAEWERFYAQNISKWKANDGINLTNILLDTKGHAFRKALAGFQPDEDHLFNLLNELVTRHIPVWTPSPTGSRPFLEGHNLSTFGALVNEILIGRYHFCAAGSAELVHFTAQARKEFALLIEGTQEQQRIYSLEKAKWISLRQDLEDLFLLIENQRLKNAHTRREWLVIFGEEEINLLEAALHYERCDIRYNLKNMNREWTLQDIEKCLIKEEAKRRLELSQLRIDTALAPHLVQHPGEEDGKETKIEPTEYLKECKTVLRQIRRLLHPDRLMHHPSYNSLTDKQKERLQELLLSALDIRPEELGFPKGYMLHDMRSLEGLKNALSRIETILGNPGIDTDERLTIKGEKLSEKLEWLRKENRILEDEILAAKAELQAFLEDEDVLKKRAIINDPSTHDTFKAKFRAQTDELRRRAEPLQKAFDALFES